MSVKINRDDEGRIKSIRTGEGMFSYAYLLNARPESDFKAGTYGTEFVIHDDDTIAAIKEYVNQVMQEAKNKEWNGTIPKNVSLPIKAGDEENELEAGHYVLKTSTKIQPKVLIRDPETGRAHEVEEDEFDQIYSGMLGEIIFTLRAYNYNGVRGITAYINAACKTGEGTPLGGNFNYEDEFSEASDFDEEVDEIFHLDDKKNKKSNKKSNKKVETKEPSIDDLIPGVKTESKKASTKKQEVTEKEEEDEDEDTEQLSIDDFLKS